MFLKLLVSLSNQHCFRGEGVYILSGIKEKRQESEISTIVWVFQLLLAAIVVNCAKYLITASYTVVLIGFSRDVCVKFSH